MAILRLVCAVACPAEQDLPENLSTLTQLKTLKLDICQMEVPRDNVDPPGLPLAAPGLQYLCLKTSREPKHYRSKCWTHDLVYLAGKTLSNIYMAQSDRYNS